MVVRVAHSDGGCAVLQVTKPYKEREGKELGRERDRERENELRCVTRRTWQ